MERVPGDFLPHDYHSAGLLTELAPAERQTLWLSALEAMARIHRVPVEPFQGLARPHLGASGLEQEIAFWDRYARWSGIQIYPVHERARRWLDDHMPETRLTGLAWGDARPCNMIFRDRACQAVIDWETVSLAGAETDLAWWLFWDWFITEGWGNPRLAGLGDRESTVKSWEHFVGRKAQDLEWHEVFATLRFSMIIQRSLELMRETHGDVGTDFAAIIRGRLSALIGS
jgi:aminoglycoside phosphotransferase (APT) family kinase protein